MGRISVQADRDRGAQAQRSLEHLSIGKERMPIEVSHAYGIAEKAAVLVDAGENRLPSWKTATMLRAADKVISGALDDRFPLFVCQAGCGTQSSMNVDEAISNRAIQLLGGAIGSEVPVHPKDDVDMERSSNDTVPTAMHVATLEVLEDRLLPGLDALAGCLEARSAEWHDVVKIGRAHLQDAVPLTVGRR